MIVPAPSPTCLMLIGGGEPNSVARVVAIAAPVGVTSSLSMPLLKTGQPRISHNFNTAGTGTAISP